MSRKKCLLKRHSLRREKQPWKSENYFAVCLCRVGAFYAREYVVQVIVAAVGRQLLKVGAKPCALVPFHDALIGRHFVEIGYFPKPEIAGKSG